MDLNYSKLSSPIGDMLLVTDGEENVRALEFSDHRAHLHRSLRDHYGEVSLSEIRVPGSIATALGRYFAGDLSALDALNTSTAGTELQREVWAFLRRIPPGRTRSYGELARELGYSDPRMAIEVGAANGANPIAVIVPCHRVIAKNGDLKGYAWGIQRKRWLLEHEKALPMQSVRQVRWRPRPPGSQAFDLR